mgnify:CR=1 FL=1
MEKETRNKAIKVAMEIGKNMLMNGAETYRVEDSMARVLESFGYGASNIFVIPTCIIITLESEEEPVTFMERIVPGSIDLERIAMSNQLSRDITEKRRSVDDAAEEIKKIEKVPMYPEWVRCIGAGVAGGFFTLLFRGSFLSFLLSTVGAIFTLWLVNRADQMRLNFFVKNMIGGLAAGLVGIAAARMFGDRVEMGAVIVGPLMTLVPGVAFANGIRDVISGELLSGATRITEAIFIAIGIAFGVGFALKILG